MIQQSINPASGATIKRYKAHSEQEVEVILAQAQRAFQTWRATNVDTRSHLIHKLADTLENSAESSTLLMTNEMGKTLSASHAELEKCVQYCRYTANHVSEFLADTRVTTEYKQAFSRPLPLGTVLLVMPWNFPFWQVLRVAVSAILAGNTCVLKHASNVPGCALALEDIFIKAGFSKGVFQALLIPSKQVENVISDNRIAAVSLTGSERAGALVAKTCGQHIKKCVLELGGSDPFIVMPSADLDAAIDAAFTSRMRNNGQSCIAAKRLIIHKGIYSDFRDGFLKRMNSIAIGDPLSASTDLGPLSSKKAFDGAERILDKAISSGAVATSSQHELPEQGFYMRPGIIEGVTRDMDLYTQEIFAPVALLFKINSLDEALDLANDSPYGLSSVLFSNDEGEQQEAIARLEAGSTYINRYASSDIRLPFGGIKRSGYGREMAREGMLEFTNLKTIIIAN